jgi:prolyl oligopeptidase
MVTLVNSGRWRYRLALRLASSFIAIGAVGSALAADGPPVAPVRPVTDSYFGTKVVDPYRWLENLQDPEVQAWMKAQADYTRAQLERISGRTALFQRIHELFNADVERVLLKRRGERYFYLSWEPGAEQPKLACRDGFRGQERVLVDPAALGNGSGTHYSLDFYQPSWDGRYVAYGLSTGGSEQSVVHVLQVDPLRLLNESIDRAQGSVISWRPDNRSFFYMRYLRSGPNTPPAEQRLNARTYLHVLNSHLDGDGDPAVFGRGVSKSLDVPDGQGTYVIVAPNSRYILAIANHNMDENPLTVYAAPLAAVTGPKAPWKKIADVADAITSSALSGSTAYLLSQKGAPNGRLLALDLPKAPLNQARVIVPETDAVLNEFALAQDAIYVRESVVAASRLRRISFDGKQSASVPTAFEGSVLTAITDPGAPGVLFNQQGWVHAATIFSYDPLANQSTDTGLDPPSKIDTSKFESKEVFATSYDGALIPLSILSKKGLALDGTHPTLLTAYGSYGAAGDLVPAFDPAIIAWLDRGGVFAVAHVRGGGEYGERWHQAGQKLTKLNTVFDMIAGAQYLVDQRYTSPRFLIGDGTSAGGITVGGALTWRPDLFGVIFDNVGLSDTLRFETEPNGPPNVPEFGSVGNEPGFHGLYAMAAYEHIRAGVAYPAVLLTTGVNDPRVAPWQMLKMAARLQAATASGKPVLLRIDYDAGHGIGSSESQYEADLADKWSFALWQIGDPEFVQARP